MSFNCPISPTRLETLTTSACDTALATATSYDHTATQTWNNTIINTILKSLISESQETKYKFCVNATIIQHLSDPSGEGKVGRRGMHSASGAYWNNEKDGMWSFKYEGGEGRGMDVVVCVMWIAV